EPSMVMMGRTVTPGDFMSISRKEMPACGFAATWVRTRQKIQSACWASADHGHAERQRRQRSGTRRLLFKEEALRDRPARSAMFFRPQRRDPPLLVQDAMPQQHLLLGQVSFGIGN